MATKGVEGSKSVLKAANDAGGDSLLFCVRKCDQKSLPQVKNYYTQSFSITNCQSFGWKCGQRWYKPFIIKIIIILIDIKLLPDYASEVGIMRPKASPYLI